MEEKIKLLIEEPILNAGYILDNVSYEKESGANFLRIVVDKKEDYINVNDCVIINDLLSPILDKIDFIEESYIVDMFKRKRMWIIWILILMNLKKQWIF